MKIRKQLQRTDIAQIEMCRWKDSHLIMEYVIVQAIRTHKESIFNYRISAI